MIHFQIATTKVDFEIIETLANVIWREHYIPIVGKAQIDYMLKKFQSVKAIRKQVSEGFEYYIILYKDEAVGYLAVKEEVDTLFLSKIYVLEKYRGKGIGKTAMQLAEQRAKKLNLASIYLTVNKNNTNSIKAYQKMGFENLGSLITDIGNGYVMDDYKMQKAIAG